MTDEGLIPDDPVIGRIQFRVRELEAAKKSELKRLSDLEEDAARIADQMRWVNEALAALTVEQDLLEAWLITAAR